MHFLPDVYVPCDVCKGQRYNRETLEIRYRGKNIHEVLEMTVEEALRFFQNVPAVAAQAHRPSPTWDCPTCGSGRTPPPSRAARRSG